MQINDFKTENEQRPDIYRPAEAGQKAKIFNKGKYHQAEKN